MLKITGSRVNSLTVKKGSVGTSESCNFIVKLSCSVTGVNISDSSGVCHGHVSQCQPRHIHVQHDVCMQYPVQNKVTFHCCYEQSKNVFLVLLSWKIKEKCKLIYWPWHCWLPVSDSAFLLLFKQCWLDYNSTPLIAGGNKRKALPPVQNQPGSVLSIHFSLNFEILVSFQKLYKWSKTFVFEK